MKKNIILLLIIALISSFSVYAYAAARAPEKNIAGKQVPIAEDFTLKDLNGKDVSLSAFKGKKVLLVFGATWCPYCVREVEDLKAFYERHQDKDVKLLNIDIQETVARVFSFVNKHNIKYTVLMDSDGNVANKYGVYGIPMIFFIDEAGIIKYQGSAPQGGFESLLK